jgi:hypothetical protein
MLNLCAPAGFQQFVLEISGPADRSTGPKPADMGRLFVLAKYQIEIHGPLPDSAGSPASK